MSLQNKTVAITGGAGVLCGGFARAMAAKGCRVAILDRADEAAAALAAEIKQEGGKAEGFFIDVLDPAAVEASLAQVESAFGSVDILINGAGGNSPRATCDSETICDEDLLENTDRKTFFSMKPQDIGFVFNLNILGTVLPSQVYCRGMAERKSGCIINVSSMNAYRPLTKIPAYSGAKAAVSNFTQWLAVHLAPAGVRVNAIAPGFFVTAQNAALLYNEDGTPTPRTGKILRATPFGRFGKAEELNGTLLWLCDEEQSAFVTGIIVPVDGGFSAYSGV